jgi:hypothetical protein
MAFKPPSSELQFCFVAVLVSLFSVTLLAQTSGEIAYPLSSAVPSLSSCGQSPDTCSPTSSTIAQPGDLNQNDADGSNRRHEGDWVRSWMGRVAKARASQPHFVSPLVTTHVMLVQQYRFDISRQGDPTGATVTSNYGASRGLEIVPVTRLEVGIFPPGYFAHQSSVPDGFGDLSWQVKFRAFSATEGKGDYFVGLFLAGSLPTGTPPNGLGHTAFSPAFAVAKGLGRCDVQTTIGANLPASGTTVLGR